VNECDFEGILAGLTEAVSISKGEADPSTFRVRVPATIDVKSIRAKTSLTQDQFAAHFGLSASAVRDWEQKRKIPDPVTRVLLMVLDREPEAVRRALNIPDMVKQAKPRVESRRQAPAKA